MTDIAEASSYIRALEACCLTGMPPGWEITEVAHFEPSIHDEDVGWVVAKIKYLKDERWHTRWAVVQDSQDYTGHG
jgi:hypothetical protein